MSIEKAPSSDRRISLRTSSTYLGLPYGAMPITLYSPSFTSKPRKAVNTL
jgi:hypothetical protein